MIHAPPGETYFVVRRLHTTAGPISLFVERGHDGRTVPHACKRRAWLVAGRMGGRAEGYAVLAARVDTAGHVLSVSFPRGDSTEGPK